MRLRHQVTGSRRDSTLVEGVMKVDRMAMMKMKLSISKINVWWSKLNLAGLTRESRVNPVKATQLTTQQVYFSVSTMQSTPLAYLVYCSSIALAFTTDLLLIAADLGTCSARRFMKDLELACWRHSGIYQSTGSVD